MNSKAFVNKEQIFHVHSHPGVDGTKGPSDIDNFNVDKYGPPMNRFIYHPSSDMWYKYSSPIVPAGFEHFNGRHTPIKINKPITLELLKR